MKQQSLTHQLWKKACLSLKQDDPVMRSIIDKYEGELLRSKKNSFETLMRSIVGQQVSVKAADTIWQRVSNAVFPFQISKNISPEAVLLVPVVELRAAGLSQRKVEYVRELSLGFTDGRIVPHQWIHLEDEEVIKNLTQIRGIGKWTAEMFLIFHLMRPNVFPVADLGLQKAISIHYKHRYPMGPKVLQKYRNKFSPWASVATWYLWRSLDPLPVEY